MSRSRKKSPVSNCLIQRNRKLAKRRSNKIVRKLDDVPDFRSYKKVYWSHDLRQVHFYETLDSFLISTSSRGWSREEAVENWNRWYRRK